MEAGDTVILKKDLPWDPRPGRCPEGGIPAGTRFKFEQTLYPSEGYHGDAPVFIQGMDEFQIPQEPTDCFSVTIALFTSTRTYYVVLPTRVRAIWWKEE